MTDGLHVNVGYGSLVANLKELCKVRFHEGDAKCPTYLNISYLTYSVTVAPSDDGRIAYSTPHHTLEEIHSGPLRQAYTEIICEYAKKWGIQVTVDTLEISKE